MEELFYIFLESPVAILAIVAEMVPHANNISGGRNK